MVLRELTPHDLKIEVDRLSAGEAMALAGYLSDILGRAHGQQMDKPARVCWAAALATARTATLHHPSWLWSAIVELLSIHEAGYLDHCRKFALSERTG